MTENNPIPYIPYASPRKETNKSKKKRKRYDDVGVCQLTRIELDTKYKLYLQSEYLKGLNALNKLQCALADEVGLHHTIGQERYEELTDELEKINEAIEAFVTTFLSLEPVLKYKKK